MSPELINAIKERIQNGHSKESIKTEVLGMGYSETLFEAAYVLAEHDTTTSEKKAPSSGKLTSIHTLVREAVTFACERWGMVLLLGIPLVLLAVLTELEMYFEGDLLTAGVVGGVSVVVMLFYLLNILAVLFLVSRGQELEKASYKEAFSWTKKNFFGILFVYLLTLLAMLGGFMLFIIPGFVVLVTVYFSQYIFVVEGERGMSALLRSRELVKGRFFAVVKKIAGLTLYFLVPVFLASFIVGIVGTFYPIEKYRLLGEVIIQAATAFFTIISMHVMFRLYRELAATEVVETTKSARLGYWTLVVVGAVTIPALIIAAVLFNGVNTLKETVPLPTESTHVIQQLNALDEQAETYRASNGSFSGVCEELRGMVTMAGEVSCNSNETEWAFSHKEADMTWCMDSTQVVPKRIPTNLGDKTACISVE